MTDKQRILAEMNLLKQQLLFIETAERKSNPIQEEPVSIDFEQELYKAFGQVKDFTLGMQIAKRFYDMGKDSKEPISDTQSPVIFYGLTGSVGNTKEEPVSEELEEAALEWFNSVKYKSDLSGTLINAFKAGAKWQKEKDRIPNNENLEKAAKKESEIVNALGGEFPPNPLDMELIKTIFIHGAEWQKKEEYTCYEEAFEAGALWKKEEMMKDAVDATVHIDAGGYPYIPRLELYDYDKDVPLAKEGDKYKVILIKED